MAGPDAQKTLFDRYEVAATLGQGAQSTVYLVHDQLNDNRPKAAKILKPEYFAQHSGTSLVQEYHLLESIDHENLVRVFDCQFLRADKAPVVITEYIENAKNLEEYLQSGELLFNERLQIAYQVISAIRYLHAKKIIHGDLKPSNILLAQSPHGFTVKLIDFGVSLDLTLEQARKRVGTPYYIAPEAVNEGVVPASDLYSLGVVLYRLFISAKLPYHGVGAQDILRQHMAGQPFFTQLEAPDLPATLLNFIQSCLDSDPLDRPRRKLGEVLRAWRLEFPAALAEMTPTSGDSRTRRFLGDTPVLEIAHNIIRERTPTAQSLTTRSILFVCAPSGGGKSRYLTETSHFCERERVSYFAYHYRPVDFWDHLVKALMARYAQTKTTRNLRSRVVEALAATDTSAKEEIYSRYLQALASELGGLVLLLDGLTDRLPLNFLSILRAATRPTQKSPARVSLILAVNERPHDEIDIPLANPIKSANLNWNKIPAQIHALGQEGLAHLLYLPPWTKAAVKTYLTDVFNDLIWEEAFLDEITQATHGNPGLLQSICSETWGILAREEKVLQGKIIQATLRELVRHAPVYDLHVYKLKYFDTPSRVVLAIMAALERVTKSDLSDLWEKTFGDSAVLQRTLADAFDNGLIQTEGSRQHVYLLQNSNLTAYLRKQAQAAASEVREGLLKIITDENPALKTLHKFQLARFLGMRRIWTRALLDCLAEEKTSAGKVVYAPYFEELRQELATYLDYTEVGWDERLELDAATIELTILELQFDRTLDLAQKLLATIAGRNDPHANALRARTELNLGSVYRIRNRFQEGIQVLEEAIHSELLGDLDHYFALGNVALCELYLAGKNPSTTTAEALENLQEARHVLKEADPVRYATLTASLGGYYLDHDQYEKSLPYLSLSSRIFGEQGEPSRQMLIQVRVGRALNFLGRYEDALSTYERAIPVLERLGLKHHIVEILANMIRSQYQLGHYRKMGPTFLQLKTLCERLGNTAPIQSVLEHMVLAYLDEGLVAQAREAVTWQSQHLKETKSPRKRYDELLCKLLLARCEQTQFHLESAQEILQDVTRYFPTGNQKDFQFHQLQQVIHFNQVELVRRLFGPQAALQELDSLLSWQTFSGVTLPEAQLLGFILAVWGAQKPAIERFLPACLNERTQFSPGNRLMFFTTLAKFYLDENRPEEARKILLEGSRLLSTVALPLARAQHFDQMARLATRLGQSEKAHRHWEHADREFSQYTKTWDEKSREAFHLKSEEWQEHRVIVLLLNAGHSH